MLRKTLTFIFAYKKDYNFIWRLSPLLGQSFLIHEDSISHTTAHHSQ